MEVALDRLIGRAAMPAEPEPKRGQTRVLRGLGHDTGFRDRTAFQQEAYEPVRSASTMCRPRALHEHATLAADGAVAIMPREALDNVVIDLAPSDAIEPQPAVKVLGLRAM